MSIKEFKCPNCGAPITFDPGLQEMLCPYCESTLNVEALIKISMNTCLKPTNLNLWNGVTEIPDGRMGSKMAWSFILAGPVREKLWQTKH